MNDTSKKQGSHSFVRNLLVFGSSVLAGMLFNIPFGWQSMLDFMTQIMIFTVITIVAGDIWYKVVEDRDKIIWQYWIGIAATLGADFCFLTASKTTSFGSMWIWLCITTFVGLLAGLWWAFVYAKAIDTDTQEEIVSKTTSSKTSSETEGA
ncbi:hypothetical protein SpiGrapes_1113 [Sphaerochaeta pleomorpha str. Grapes]|uniref:Holin n=1 Tax=Sphaerochaeta pleomorpha (strain ATCC BAA-1885 / DSM 22778 / Grapes) TaxID=158190 RepID=G8QS72_SPHPG|nr:hypothetical protein [Sphaerochaeta pleomorpha]AEV28933.1 hypothetical protein SpiGrapes_1113 [Sphaerochaeta pleomorpha str. Grapes]